MSDMTRVEMYEKMIRDELNKYLEELQEEKAKFVERFQKSEFHSSSTIEWNTDDIVIAEVKAKLAYQIFSLENSENEMDLLAACKYVMDRVKSDMLNNYSGNSTNPVANAIKLFEREGNSRFLRSMEIRIIRYEDALAEEQEAEERRENVNDVTTYALRAQYCTMLNQVQKYLRMEDEAKAQRDKKAAHEALVAVNNSIQDLSKLAEDLGINLTNTEN